MDSRPSVSATFFFQLTDCMMFPQAQVNFASWIPCAVYLSEVYAEDEKQCHVCRSGEAAIYLPSTFNFRLKSVDWSLRIFLRLCHILHVIYPFFWVVCEPLRLPTDQFKNALLPRRPVPTSPRESMVFYCPHHLP